VSCPLLCLGVQMSGAGVATWPVSTHVGIAGVDQAIFADCSPMFGLTYSGAGGGGGLTVNLNFAPSGRVYSGCTPTNVAFASH